MARQKYRFPLMAIPTFFCILGIIWIDKDHMGNLNNTIGFWIAMTLLIAIALLVVIPPFMFRRLGYILGQTRKKAVFKQKSQEHLHESERAYEQGYQATASNTAQAFSDAPDTYELPQAQYPQQQLPPM